MVFRGLDTLWITWVKMNILGNKSFRTIRAAGSSSWCWKKLLKLREIFRHMALHKVGNGNNIHVWHDNWHPRGPFIIAYGENVTHLIGIPLDAKLSSVINGTIWRWPHARSNDMKIISHINDIVSKNEDDLGQVCFKLVSLGIGSDLTTQKSHEVLWCGLRVLSLSIASYASLPYSTDYPPEIGNKK